MSGTAGFVKLSERLLHRRVEIWQKVLTRANQLAAVPAMADRGYVEGMRAAALAAVDYGTGILEDGSTFPPVPPQLLEQARLSARRGISMDSVVRRYFGGYSAYSGAVIEEAHRSGLSPESVKQVMDRLAEGFDRLVSAVAAEYAEQLRQRSNESEKLRLKLIESLLAGDSVDSRGLGFKLDRNHLGVVTAAAEVNGLLRELGRHLDRHVLIVQRNSREVWAWFGGRHQLRREDIDRALAPLWPKDVPLGLGEDCHGPAGWRLTHRQANRSWHTAARNLGIVRYREVALSSAILEDEDLLAFLHQSYLVPLLGTRGGRESPLRETLSTYFRADGNISSTAAALGVSRQTVTNRLSQAEARLGESIANCRVELECALRLAERDEAASPGYPS